MFRLKSFNNFWTGFVVALMFSAAHLLAQSPSPDPNAAPATPSPTENNQAASTSSQLPEGEHVLVIKTLPSKKLVGAIVTNGNSERIGSISDLAIDLESGKIAYAALAVGGVAGGLGEKLFAVPFAALKISNDTNNNVAFFLDIPKQQFDNSPGFDKAHWPDSVSPQWRAQVEGN